MKASYFKHELIFKRTSRTSRGELNTHTSHIIQLTDGRQNGYGEAAPLKGLSIDDRADFEQQLQTCCTLINDGLPLNALPTAGFPALQFAFETAGLSLQQVQPFKVYDNAFIKGTPLPINGLVWMNDKDTMLKEAQEKIEQGFTCIKFKVGALDFDEECRMLEAVRKHFNAFKIEIRLDANGAFAPDEALEKLNTLHRFDVHSLEQPIRAGQREHMHELCRKSKLPLALDEELIGHLDPAQYKTLLQTIQPAYIILKPTLIGGFAAADQWIQAARTLQIGWWATSALESNIGLNAIAQWCSNYQLALPQGLGTGHLYTNNFASPLTVAQGQLFYNPQQDWAKIRSIEA